MARKARIKPTRAPNHAVAHDETDNLKNWSVTPSRASQIGGEPTEGRWPAKDILQSGWQIDSRADWREARQTAPSGARRALRPGGGRDVNRKGWGKASKERAGRLSQYHGAACDVMSRGNRGADISIDDDDRRMFLKTLGEADGRQAEKLDIRGLKTVNLFAGFRD